MRAALLILVVTAACHPPSLQDRARDMGHKFAALGAKVHVNVDVKTAALDVARTQLAQHPIVIHQHASPVAEEPASVAASEPAAVPMTVHRVDASQPTYFGMSYTRGDGSNACTRFATLEACNTSCTQLSQQRGLAGQPHASCSCLEDAPGC